MQYLELLAPARNKDIGIAAINCGADAVYIAGPDFGARKAAGNSFEDIRELCEYAHRFGVRIFVTYNIEIRKGEEDLLHSQMLQAQEAGADAFIIRDPRICGWDDIRIPLHASTQCAIRDGHKASYFESLGCSRLVLERELSLEEIRRIRKSVACELEFFVHGALCVCYSGECRLSEKIDGRSADRGECIQACRSLYDLKDENAKLLARNKALLSLKDYNLKNRLEELADCGICSFKIEGRLKNESYVKNVVRDYSLALDALVAKYPDRYCRSSFGKVSGGFTPDTDKTFNRSYTELYLDGKRGQWSSMDAPKSMGEAVGKVKKLSRQGHKTIIDIEAFDKNLTLNNGDGFAFSTKDGVVGFRADICEGRRIICKELAGIKTGITLYRNISTAFEKMLESNNCRREIAVELKLKISGEFSVEIYARSEDGREFVSSYNMDVDKAENKDRAEAMLREQLSKRSAHYKFTLSEFEVTSKSLPLLSASTINSMRRLLAEDLDCYPCKTMTMQTGARKLSFDEIEAPVREREEELMRSRYCVRYEMGLCPKHHGSESARNLYLHNNGRRFTLVFDCKACEMVVKEDQK